MNNLIKLLKKNRVKPNHEISQWYMFYRDIKKQVKFLVENLKCENMVFLGDGDGISILLAMTLAKSKCSNIKKIFVFDIDERELNLYNKLAKEQNVNKYVQFVTVQYNIFDVVPSKYVNAFDWFYINPPYSSTTTPKGLGFHLWLERCIEMSKPNAKGIIVYPYNKLPREIEEVKMNLYNFINEKNFNIIKSNSLSHRYYETRIKSRNLIIEKTSKTHPKYKNIEIPLDIAFSLYHNDKLPHYVIDDGSGYGKYENFDKD